jgi:iron complex transport system ATP-binding protein
MESVVLQNLSIGYTAKGQQHLVASNIHAALRSGELTCLLGRNGVGKSTLLRTLAAFQPALSGDVLINGKALSTLTEKQLSHRIGIVLTEKPDVRNMSVEEMVAMGRSPYTGFWGGLKEKDRDIVRQAIQQTGIESLKHRQIETLSDGERQKVMIAKALAQHTSVIYLDEPTAFLDFPSKVEMMQLLHRLAAEEEKTIFLSTHDVELALQLADRIWLMESDALYVGTPRELAQQGVLERFIEHSGIRFDKDTLTIQVIP